MTATPRTPVFQRSLRLGLEETDLVLRLFDRRASAARVMVDVGAHRGTSTMAFARQGWRVHAFEPDPKNRFLFEQALGDFDNVTVDARAVSDRNGEEVVLYDSEESSGISSLLAFSESHRRAALVETVRLDTFAAEIGLERVDFLKIDTEGYDLMVLRGFPWDELRPEVVLCEFEDRKTTQLGYTTADLLELLGGLGYELLVSEWHPIEQYGVTHSFAQLRRFDGSVPPMSSWGNVIAVLRPDEATAMVQDAARFIERRNRLTNATMPSLRYELWKGRARVVNWGREAVRRAATSQEVS